MTIKLNDKSFEVEEGTTLAAFIRSQDISLQGVAIAIGYEVVPKSLWTETVLAEGMELILIQAVSGG